ncbi:hypothetical protein ACFVJ8_23860 [Streptomyces yangpuensis]|uniref:hypothetical protein n=1 Tax=Streptomyces yangpuensis TaxID=1648182 RepID=UPI0036375326
MSYDMYIWGREAWDELLQRDLGIIIDPLVFRTGQFFLEGGPVAGRDTDARWGSITDDVGALVSFFDLVVMHDKLPAFNYHDAFDKRLDFGDRLGAVLNTHGDKTLVHVDIEHHMYREAKAGAIHQLSQRLTEGPFVPASTSQEILSMLTAAEYEWEPSLETLKPQLANADEARIARFLLGQLVFAGYAQQTGAPHVLAPKRSRMLTAVGLGAAGATPTAEGAIYEELRRRFRDAGPGWRDEELPWTPSFLPFLLKRMNQYQEGPDVLLEQAKELRGTKAIARYRELRKALMSENAEVSADARKELSAAANAVASALDSPREELEVQRHIVVEVLPKAVGAVGGALVGALVAGPPGAAAGGLVGVVGEEALRPLHDRLWGWVIDRLPFRSARKLLTRSAKAEHELRAELVPQLHAVWETGRRAS